jgi:hypothetical protein
VNKIKIIIEIKITKLISDDRKKYMNHKIKIRSTSDSKTQIKITTTSDSKL